VPAHSGVRGNEEADEAARRATLEGAKVTDEPTRVVTEIRLIWKLVVREMDDRSHAPPSEIDHYSSQKTHYNCDFEQILVVVYISMCADVKKNFCSYVKYSRRC
jgi:hypothetical protein